MNASEICGPVILPFQGSLSGCLAVQLPPRPQWFRRERVAISSRRARWLTGRIDSTPPPTPDTANSMVAPGEPLSRERLRVGRVSYVAEVFAEEGRFRGHWNCVRCGQAGKSGATYCESATAAAWAKSAAAVHHLAVHADN
jgi:hypothetical protein